MRKFITQMLIFYYDTQYFERSIIYYAFVLILSKNTSFKSKEIQILMESSVNPNSCCH
jgi:hypothetical protein